MDGGSRGRMDRFGKWMVAALATGAAFVLPRTQIQ
jgi:hypothetical protein